MKNKKLLNFYMLTIALLSFISFLLPLTQIDPASNGGVAITIVYYTLNSIMCLSLVLVIVIALINMFKDNYEMLGVMKALALIAFLMVFVVLFVFATSLNYALGWGYILIAFEVFLLFALVPIIKMFQTFKSVNVFIKKVTAKPEAEKEEVKEKPARKAKKEESVEVEEVVIKDTATKDSQNTDPTTGEK